MSETALGVLWLVLFLAAAAMWAWTSQQGACL